MLNINDFSLNFDDINTTENELNNKEATESTNDKDKFPTVGLRSLLQNSELLELLLKPFGSPSSPSSSKEGSLTTGDIVAPKLDANVLSTNDSKSKNDFEIDLTSDLLEGKLPLPFQLSILNINQPTMIVFNIFILF